MQSTPSFLECSGHVWSLLQGTQLKVWPQAKSFLSFFSPQGPYLLASFGGIDLPIVHICEKKVTLRDEWKLSKEKI